MWSTNCVPLLLVSSWDLYNMMIREASLPKYVFLIKDVTYGILNPIILQYLLGNIMLFRWEMFCKIYLIKSLFCWWHYSSNDIYLTMFEYWCQIDLSILRIWRRTGIRYWDTQSVGVIPSMRFIPTQLGHFQMCLFWRYGRGRGWVCWEAGADHKLDAILFHFHFLAFSFQIHFFTFTFPDMNEDEDEAEGGGSWCWEAGAIHIYFHFSRFQY